MLIFELKEILIHRIQTIDDESFLNAIKILTDSKVTDQSYELSEFEQQKIANARKQVENGNIATQEEMFKKVDAWLKE